jgi:hypothetical protein
MSSGRQLKFAWRGVVLEKGNSLVTHFGRSGPLQANTVTSARDEVDGLKPVTPKDAMNCYQILDGDGRVVSYRIVNPETGRARWS